MKPDRLGARAVRVKMVLLFRPWFTQGEGLCPSLTHEAEGEMDFSRYVSTSLSLSLLLLLLLFRLLTFVCQI